MLRLVNLCFYGSIKVKIGGKLRNMADQMVLTDEWKEKLIEEVKSRPALWNKSEKMYANRIAKNNCWIEIGVGLGAELGLENMDAGGGWLLVGFKTILQFPTLSHQWRSQGGGRICPEISRSRKKSQNPPLIFCQNDGWRENCHSCKKEAIRNSRKHFFYSINEYL
ncbi:MAG: hypothetical protein GY820_42600 [Gammaproteobacteria bacterium]|nr:hypothetical protein [Gammaproteobacteria bacterium]